MSNRNDFGDRIRRLRELAGLKLRTLDQLAGLKNGHVRQIEGGGRAQTAATTIAVIADVFGVSLDWLYRGVGVTPVDAQVRAAVDRAKARLARKARRQAA